MHTFPWRTTCGGRNRQHRSNTSKRNIPCPVNRHSTNRQRGRNTNHNTGSGRRHSVGNRSQRGRKRRQFSPHTRHKAVRRRQRSQKNTNLRTGGLRRASKERLPPSQQRANEYREDHNHNRTAHPNAKRKYCQVKYRTLKGEPVHNTRREHSTNNWARGLRTRFKQCHLYKARRQARLFRQGSSKDITKEHQ